MARIPPEGGKRTDQAHSCAAVLPSQRRRSRKICHTPIRDRSRNHYYSRSATRILNANRSGFCFAKGRSTVAALRLLQIRYLLLPLALVCLLGADDKSTQPWIVYDGFDGPGKGKHIVLVSGDEEYRSEEALPQLGKILAKHHGFKCTVLFAIDPTDGTINPNQNNNIPGLEALKTADLMIIFTRFRNLPDEQLKPIIDYVEAGKPVIGLRTATHAFNLNKSKEFAKYSWGNKDKSY